VTDLLLLGPSDDVVDATFDEATHTWTVRTSTDTRCARIVIAANGHTPAVNVRDHVELRPYLGVAVHGAPNYFLCSRPEAPRQRRYIAECLEHMKRSGSTRIEVRYSTQRVYNDRVGQPNWRRMREKIPSAFEFGSRNDIDDGIYDGPAIIGVADGQTAARVRLTGRIDPIDGRYHWRGTILGAFANAARLPQAVTLTIGDRVAQGRVTERTQQGCYSVAGVGIPPFERTAMVSTTAATTPPMMPEISSGT
jgi:hypothetical protein